MSPMCGSPMPVGQLVDDQAILIRERRRHALAFDARDLEAERDDERRVDRRRGQRLQPGDQLFDDALHPQRAAVDRQTRVRRGREAARQGRHRLGRDQRFRRAQRVGRRHRLGSARGVLRHGGGGGGAYGSYWSLITLDTRGAAWSAIGSPESRALAVAHLQDVVPAEPGHDLLDFIDVHQVRPVHPPEYGGVEPRL